MEEFVYVVVHIKGEYDSEVSTTIGITCDSTLAKNFAAKAAEEINAKKNYDFDQDIILLRQYRFNRYLVGQEPSDTQWDWSALKEKTLYQLKYDVDDYDCLTSDILKFLEENQKLVKKGWDNKMSNTSLEGLLDVILLFVMLIIIIGAAIFADKYGDKSSPLNILGGALLTALGSLSLADGFNALLNTNDIGIAFGKWGLFIFMIIGLGIVLTGMYEAYKGFRNKR